MPLEYQVKTLTIVISEEPQSADNVTEDVVMRS